MPAYVVIPIDGLAFHENLLDELMFEPVFVREIIAGFMPSLEYLDLAEIELDYHCMHLMEESAQGGLHQWFDPLMGYVKYVGGQIFRWMRDNGAYLNGQLPYRLSRICGACLYFQRNDLFAQEVNEELRNEEHQTTWLPRAPAPRDPWFDPYYGVPHTRSAADEGADRELSHANQHFRTQPV